MAEDKDAPAPTGPQGEPGDRPEKSPDGNAFILDRARSEVHLLLDNISANPDVTIASLTSRTPPAGLPDDWIEKICEITWPPKTEDADPDELAKQASLLIKVRDYLNGLAKPASGATIAFTLMVTQEDKAARRRGRSDRAEPPSRSSLAREAYPDLQVRAQRFRTLLRSMNFLAIGCLVITLAISWYLAVGNAALADFATAHHRLDDANERVSQAQSAVSSEATSGVRPRAPIAPQAQAGLRAAPANANVQQPQTGPQPPQPPVSEFVRDPCIAVLPTGAYRSAEMRDACMARDEQQRSFSAITTGLDSWAPFVGPDTSAWLANLLGSNVLPVLYGILGAIAAVVRSLSRKIKASLLSPRDLQLSFQKLALGAVIGACISLFIGRPGGDGAGPALLGPVALSASAISFVAGFGVESVFAALEALISRIFNLAPVGNGGPQDQRASP